MPAASARSLPPTTSASSRGPLRGAPPASSSTAPSAAISAARSTAIGVSTMAQTRVSGARAPSGRASVATPFLVRPSPSPVSLEVTRPGAPVSSGVAKRTHRLGRLHLRQHDHVRCRPPHGIDVVRVPGRAGRVDAQRPQLRSVVLPDEGRDRRLACGRLARRSDRVLQVDDDRVGVEARALRQRARVAGRHVEGGAADRRLGHLLVSALNLSTSARPRPSLSAQA